MRPLSQLYVVCSLVLMISAPGSAQELGAREADDAEVAEVAEVSARNGGTSQPALTLRPTESLVALAAEVQVVLERRTGREVLIGAPPPMLIEAVPRDHVGMNASEGDVSLVLGAPDGRNVSATVPQMDDVAAQARAVALAIESLGDEAEMLPPVVEPSNEETFIEAPRAPTTVAPIARPTLFLKLMVGFSPIRRTAIVGPGAGLGLCVGAHCLVLEAGLSLLPQYETNQRGETVRYRPVNASLRAILRPYQDERFAVGIGIGFLTRVGRALLLETDRHQVVTNFGLRGTVEFAVRIRGPFEWVVDAGVDFAVSRARFIRSGATIFLEDRWNPFLVTSLRVRP